MNIKLAAVLAAGLLTATPYAHADLIFDFTADHLSGGAGVLPPFGNVTLHQDGANVDVTVHLVSGFRYILSGAGDGMDFKFNATGVSLLDITIDAHLPQFLHAETGAFNGDGTGNFTFGITGNPPQGNGAGDAFSGDIIFHVASATIAELSVANSDGYVFAADVLAPNGNTGAIGATGSGRPSEAPPLDSVPESSTFAICGSLALFGLVGRRFIRRTSGALAQIS